MRANYFQSEGNDWVKKVIFHFSKQAANYSRNSSSWPWRWIRAREQKCIKRLLELHSIHSVLEVGCGAGFYASWLSGVVEKFVAIDACQEMVQECRGLGISVECGRLEKWNSSQKFQRILAAGVLEFACDPGEFLRAAESRLEIGGRLVLLVPHAGWRGWIYSRWHRLFGCPVRVISPSELTRVAAASGLRVDSVESAGPISFGVSLERLAGEDLGIS